MLFHEWRKVAPLDHCFDLLVRPPVLVCVVMVLVAMSMIVVLFVPVIMVMMPVLLLMLMVMMLFFPVLMPMLLLVIMIMVVLVLVMVVLPVVMGFVRVRMLVLVTMLAAALMRVRVFMFVRMSMLMLVLIFMSMLAAIPSMRRAAVDVELHSLDVLPLGAVVVHVKIAHVQFAQFPLQRAGFHTEVDERANHHVAADAGNAVEIKCLHECGKNPSLGPPRPNVHLENAARSGGVMERG
jgi:hypothetical protein